MGGLNVGSPSEKGGHVLKVGIPRLKRPNDVPNSRSSSKSRPKKPTCSSLPQNDHAPNVPSVAVPSARCPENPPVSSQAMTLCTKPPESRPPPSSPNAPNVVPIMSLPLCARCTKQPKPSLPCPFPLPMSQMPKSHQRNPPSPVPLR